MKKNILRVLASLTIVSQLVFMGAPLIQIASAEEINSDSSVNVESQIDETVVAQDETIVTTDETVETTDETVTTADETVATDESVISEPSVTETEQAEPEIVTEEITPEPVIEENNVLIEEVLSAETTEPTPVPQPELTTDKPDYQPGETVSIFGRFFQALQNIFLKISGGSEKEENYTETNDTVTADEQGSFTYLYNLDNTVRPLYTVIASNLSGEQLAQTTFNDSIKSLLVKYPNGGEKVSGTINVQFNVDQHQQSGGTVYIYYSKNGCGGPWNLITSNYYSNDGAKSIQWDTTGDVDGSNYCIKVSDNESSDLDADTSNAVFIVQNVGVSLNPQHDTYVQVGDASHTHDDADLHVKWGSKDDDDKRRSYLKFNISSIPSGVTITSATLYLYQFSAQNDGSVGVYKVSNNYQSTVNPWTEGGLTYNNAPTDWSTGATTAVDNNDGYKSLTVSTTDVTNALSDGILSLSVRIAPESGSYHHDFCDMEGTGNECNLTTRPELVILYTAPPAQGSLTVTKVVVNNNGGNATETDFTLLVNETPKTWGEPIVLSPGTYTISETSTIVGYAATFSGNGCNATDTVTIVAGQSYTCTITNDDIAPSLTLVKTVDNAGGGTAIATNWDLTASGSTTISGAGGATSDVTFSAGTYTLSEATNTAITGNYASGSWLCEGVQNEGDRITLRLGESATSTITNTFIPPTKGLLTVAKVVTNDNGGTAQVSDFNLYVGSTLVTSGTTTEFATGTYTISETGSTTGYAATFSGDCNGTDTITIVAGQSYTCTITNDDIAPTLTLIKTVVNDNGGTATTGEFTFYVGETQATSSVMWKPENFEILGVFDKYPTIKSWLLKYWIVGGNAQRSQCFTTNNGTGVENLVLGSYWQVSLLGSNQTDCSNLSTFILDLEGGDGLMFEVQEFEPGDYQITEQGPTTGYTASFAGDCNPSGTITIVAGQHYNCTITNNDIAPELTVIKQVISGGTATASDFTINVTGTNVSSSSFPGDASGTTVTLNAGQYSVTEATATSYLVSYDNCSGTIGIGDTKTCTITNTYQAPAPVCGDGLCNGSETCSSCSQDCGSCAYGGGGGGGGSAPLIIYEETVSDVGDTWVIITWKTKISGTDFPYLASSQVIYSREGEVHTLDLTDTSGTPPKYGYAHTTPEYDTNPKVTSHSVTITGLNSGTTYYYRTVSHASLVISTEYSFTTLGVKEIGEIEEQIPSEVLPYEEEIPSAEKPSVPEGAAPPEGGIVTIPPEERVPGEGWAPLLLASLGEIRETAWMVIVVVFCIIGLVIIGIREWELARKKKKNIS